MAYAFDGTTHTITISAQTTLSVRDLYSRWADWFATSDNCKYLPAFATLGGDDIDPGAGTTVPVYAFLINAWRIRPDESNHTLLVNDGILLVQGGGDPFLDTLSSYFVRVNYQQPVQAITVSTGGGLDTTQEERLARIEKLLRNKQITSPATGKMTVYEDDGVTVLAEANLFENASGTQAYRGQGVERRERLA